MNPFFKGKQLRVGLALVCGLALLAAGCETTSPGPRPTAPAPAQTAKPVSTPSVDYIHVGDKVDVIFTDLPQNDLPGITQTVPEDGRLTLPMGVTVVAAGKKAGELRDAIHAEYVPKWFKRLTVAVRLDDRFIYVGGQVRRPDRYVFSGDMTVLAAIKVAGDFTEFAQKSDVKVTRADGTEFIVDCKKAIKNSKYDTRVYPGDSIYVKQRVIW